MKSLQRSTCDEYGDGDDDRFNSREVAGMIGLYNEGATCYMNSYLQTLYHTTALRKAVYQLPPPSPPPSEDGTAVKRSKIEDVGTALKRLFYNLQ